MWQRTAGGHQELSMVPGKQPPRQQWCPPSNCKEQNDDNDLNLREDLESQGGSSPANT